MMMLPQRYSVGLLRVRVRVTERLKGWVDFVAALHRLPVCLCALLLRTTLDHKQGGRRRRQWFHPMALRSSLRR